MEYTYKQIIGGFSEQISSEDQNILLASMTVRICVIKDIVVFFFPKTFHELWF